MKILIAEDQPVQADAIKKTLQSNYPDCIIKIATSYKEAYSLILIEHFHIFIMDIDLGPGYEDGGIRLSEYIRSIKHYRITPIIFLTSVHTDLGKIINTTHCYSFLNKPYSEEELMDILKTISSTPLIPRQTIEFKDVNGIYIRLMPEDIIFVEVLGHKLTINTSYNSYITSKLNLSQIIDISAGLLLKCYKSFAVNPKHIISYSRDHICVTINNNNNVKIPISRSFYSTLLGGN